MSDPDIPPLAGKNFTKVVIIVVSLGGVFALCVAACWVLGVFANNTLCDLGYEGCK